MSTYIVEVDSSYRDLNSYPNQCDFAVSFNQNLTSAAQVLGQPYSFTGQANNYFTKSSIDPDYQNTNLRMIGGSIQSIQRLNTSFYISGIAYSEYSNVFINSTGCVMYDGYTPLFELYQINAVSPFVCRLDQQVDGSFLYQWCVYAISLTNEFPYCVTSQLKVSEKGGIFWTIETNFQDIVVQRKDSVSPIVFPLYNISDFHDVPSQMTNVIFALNTSGQPYEVQNRPWGYHILKSSYSISSITSVGKCSIETDPADNIYLSTNIDATQPYYGITYKDPSLPWNGYCAAQNSICVYRYVTGSSGSYTGSMNPSSGELTEYCIMDTDIFSITSDFVSQYSYLLGIKSRPDSLNDITCVYEKPLSFFGNPNLRVSNQNYMCQIGNKIYYFTVPAVIIFGAYPGAFLPMLVYELEPITGQLITVAASPFRYCACSIAGTQIGTNIYIAARTNEPTIAIYMYQYNALTYTLSELTSIVLPTFVSYYAQVVTVQKDSDHIILVSPDSDYVLIVGDRTQRCKTLWLMYYTISTNNLAITNGSIQIYPSANRLMINSYKSNRILLTIIYYFPYVIDIIDITDPFNPFLAATLNINVKYNAAFVYSHTELSGEVVYLLSVTQGSNGSSIYNITDLDNIVLVSSSIVPNKYFEQDFLNPCITNACTTYNTSYGYIYTSSYLGDIVKVRNITYPSPTITSSHYYYNNQSLTVLPYDDLALFKAVRTITVNGVSYMMISNEYEIRVYSLTNFTIPVYINRIRYAIPMTSFFIDTAILQLDDNMMYIAVWCDNMVYLYYTDILFTSPTLVWTGLPSVTTIGAVAMAYTSQSPVPIVTLVLSERKWLHRKYNVTPYGVALIAQDTFTDGAVNSQVLSSEIIYYPSFGRYFLFVVGMTLNGTVSALRSISIDVTLPPFLFLACPTPGNIGAGWKMTYWSYVLKLFNQYVPKTVGAAYHGNLWGASSTVIDFSYPPIGVAPIALFNGKNENVIPATIATSIYNVRCTTWKDAITKRQYIAFNTNGRVNTHDYITILETTVVSNMSTPTNGINISVEGNISDITAYTFGAKTFLYALIRPLSTGPSTLYIYDVSNVSNAEQYQTPGKIEKVYDNIQAYCGGAVIHQINTLGQPQWLDVVGGDLLPCSTNVSVCSLSFDNINSIYISGTWGRKVQFYTSQNSNYEILNPYASNQFTISSSDLNGFVAKIDINEGAWEYALPLLAEGGDMYMTDSDYSLSIDRLYLTFYFSSINLYLYGPQQSTNYSTGSNTYPSLQKQFYFYNTSAANSVLLSLDTEGIFQWRSVLYAAGGDYQTILRSVSVDESNSVFPKIVVCGNNNATVLQGVDGQRSVIQTLYPQINPLNQTSSIVYQYSLSGAYISSSYQSFPQDCIVITNVIQSFSDINELFVINQVNPPLTFQPGYAYNKDSSLGGPLSVYPLCTNSLVSVYDTNSLYLDTNNFYYSTVWLYNFTGPIDAIQNTPYQNSYVFVLGDEEDRIINKNFIIRSASYDTTVNALKLVLNQQILTSALIRTFSTINNIPFSNQYYSSNFSVSPLYDIGLYSLTGGISISGNSITFSHLFNHSPGTFDLTKEYYFMIPTLLALSSNEEGLENVLTNLVPILNITYNSSFKQYTMTVQNINDLRVPSPSGSFYGPYLNIGQKNYSAFYSLQWYPGARLYAQSYLVGLYDLIIPNRPVRNAQFPGVRYLTDYPYIYLVIYNADEAGNFDSTVVNSVYDNNVNVPRFALFQLPTTSFISFGQDSNFISASSSATPRIRFIPGYYKLRFRLTDDLGNVLYFDNAPSKESDSIFSDGVVPEKLLKVTVRMAFKRG